MNSLVINNVFFREVYLVLSKIHNKQKLRIRSLDPITQLHELTKGNLSEPSHSHSGSQRNILYVVGEIKNGE